MDKHRNVISVEFFAARGTPLENLFKHDKDVARKIEAGIRNTLLDWKDGVSDAEKPSLHRRTVENNVEEEEAPGRSSGGGGLAKPTVPIAVLPNEDLDKYFSVFIREHVQRSDFSGPSPTLCSKVGIQNHTSFYCILAGNQLNDWSCHRSCQGKSTPFFTYNQ